MTFSRIKREYTEAPYKRSFLLETANVFFVSENKVDNMRLVELEKKIDQLVEKIEFLSNPKPIVGNDTTGRKFKDNQIGKSCKEYLEAIEPTCCKIKIESGFYWILPDSSQDPFKVYCDMETDGGGWTFYYTTDRIVHLTSFSKSNPVNFTQNGYFADLRNFEFTDILYVRINDMAKDWFKQSNKIKINNFIVGNVLSMNAGNIYDKFSAYGGAISGIYQLTIADNANGFSQGIMISGLQSNFHKTCIKQPNYWCGDQTSNYYRSQALDSIYQGNCFREKDGHKNCPNTLFSVAIR